MSKAPPANASLSNLKVVRSLSSWVHAVRRPTGRITMFPKNMTITLGGGRKGQGPSGKAHSTMVFGNHTSSLNLYRLRCDAFHLMEHSKTTGNGPQSTRSRQVPTITRNETQEFRLRIITGPHLL